MIWELTALPPQLGPYTIEREIGRGGMGVVYLGHDTKLDRAVAIKALPEHLAQDAERLARFEREARTLAQLNHPNVAGIHGVEEHGGARYLVLEYVEGPTLSERLDGGPLAVDEAILVCAQIAAGLEAAHDAGVIHRDLKPANIKITPAGHVKVLDFGLAKTTEGASTTGSSMSQVPTMTTPATPNSPTSPGAILGTAPYMSPEQARGRTLDQRSDIWSFGVVLYECLTGLSPFAGETMSDSIGAILHRQPDVSLLPAETPASVRHLLRRCLQRDKAKRLHSIADARIELEDPGETGPSSETAAPAKRAHPLALVVIAAACVALGVAAMWFLAPMFEEAPRPIHLKIERGTDAPRYRFPGAQFAISPDGSSFVFSAGSSAVAAQLYVRRFDRFEATALSGTAGATQPFFSPDGQWVGFFANNKLKKVNVTGGAPLTLCDAGGAERGGSWGDDGTIAFTPDTSTGISLVSSSGGEVRQLTAPDTEARERSHRWPHVLPGSKAVLFVSQVRGNDFDNASIEVVTIEGGERKVLHHGGSNPKYASSGHLVFGRSSTLYASSFDPVSLELFASPTPLFEGVTTDPPTGGVEFAMSNSGALLFGQGDPRGMRTRLEWSDRAGNRTPITTDSALSTAGSLSPDGTRIAMQIYSDGSGMDIWIYEIERKALSRLTFSEFDEMNPVWSPDSQEIVYSDTEGSEPNLFIQRADGSGEPRQLTNSPMKADFSSSWSSDGAHIAFLRETGTSGADLMTLAVDEDGAEPEIFLATQFEERYAVFSPDGRWVVYSSNETGRPEVYVRSFPRGGGRWQVSIDGGSWPAWSPDGTEILFNWDGVMYSAAVSGGGESFRADTPVALFNHSLPHDFFYPQYSVTPDGQDFMLLTARSDGSAEDDQTLSLILNWFTELEARAGGGN